MFTVAFCAGWCILLQHCAIYNLLPDFFFNSDNAGTVTSHSSTTDTEPQSSGPEGSESMVILDSDDEGAKGSVSLHLKKEQRKNRLLIKNVNIVYESEVDQF